MSRLCFVKKVGISLIMSLLKIEHTKALDVVCDTKLRLGLHMVYFIRKCARLLGFVSKRKHYAFFCSKLSFASVI